MLKKSIELRFFFQYVNFGHKLAYFNTSYNDDKYIDSTRWLREPTATVTFIFYRQNNKQVYTLQPDCTLSRWVGDDKKIIKFNISSHI